MKHDDLCPWQAGPVLASPLRKLLHNPSRMLAPYLSKGMTAVDIGSGMGFFTLPMCALAGETGRVIAVDLQREMLSGLRRKAAKAGVTNLRLLQCAQNSLQIQKLTGKADFALLFWMLHEVPDPERLIRELRAALSATGRLLFAEPKAHVSAAAFEKSLTMILNCGFAVAETPKIAVSRAVVLGKKD
jgi:ubiquinone/menaquinone biosynthesis C-methylase UbiE